MAGILSQEEIDALMTAVTSGELVVTPAEGPPGGQMVSGFDFRRPHRLTKEHIRILTTIHENMARLMANSLSAYLRCVVEVQVVSVSNISYAEYQQALPNPTGISLLACPPFDGSTVFEVNQSLLLAMIDRLFGGPGLLGSDSKPLTTLEQTVIQKIVRKALADLVEAWKGVATLEPKVELLESNPQFLAIASPGDMVLFVSLEIKLPRASAFASLCYQHRDVEEALHRTTEGDAGMSRVRKPTPIPGELWREGIAPTSLPITGVLGRARIRVGELLNLRVGDVVRLDTTPAGTLPVMISGAPKARGRLGRVGRHRAIELTHIQ
jgi:flagellar motor switch protein FliM